MALGEGKRGRQLGRFGGKKGREERSRGGELSRKIFIMILIEKKRSVIIIISKWKVTEPEDNINAA